MEPLSPHCHIANLSPLKNSETLRKLATKKVEDIADLTPKWWYSVLKAEYLNRNNLNYPWPSIVFYSRLDQRNTERWESWSQQLTWHKWGSNIIIVQHSAEYKPNVTWNFGDSWNRDTLIQRLHKAIKLTRTNANSLQYCFKDVLICLSDQPNTFFFFIVRDINRNQTRVTMHNNISSRVASQTSVDFYSLNLLECTILAELLVKEFSSVSEETQSISS